MFRKYILLSVSLLWMSTYTHAQDPPDQMPHQFLLEDKKTLLSQLWQRPMHWFPHSALQNGKDEIQMILPSDFVEMGINFMDSILDLYVNTYYYFGLGQHLSPTDTVVGVFLSDEDTTKVVFSKQYCSCLFSQSPTLESLCGSLLYFSPFLKLFFTQPGEAVIYLKYKEPIDKRDAPVFYNYAGSFAGIIGKYFIKDVKDVERILIIWEDATGSILPSVYYPHSKDFEQKYKWL